MSNIEWTEQTWNPVIGCEPVSPGCLNCYAATMANRLRHNPKSIEYHDRADGVPVSLRRYYPSDGKAVRIAEIREAGQDRRAVFTGEVRTLPDRLGWPINRRKPTVYFVCSMSDLFHPSVPFEFIDRVFAVMSLCRHHTFQVLTKRPERMAEYLSGENRRKRINKIAEHAIIATKQTLEARDRWPLPNVWLGTSCEDQQRADERIPHLLECPAAVRFLSCEPLLGPIDLTRWITLCRASLTVNDEQMEAALKDGRFGHREAWALHWVIVGGESGPNARPCHAGWIRSIVEQCQQTETAVFVKQLGAVVWDRNDAGFDGDEHQEQRPDGSWGPANPRAWSSQVRVEHHPDGDSTIYQGAPVRVHLHSIKGGNPDEWPEDLRVRQMPIESEVAS